MSTLDPDVDHLILLFSADGASPVWFRGARNWGDMQLSDDLAVALDAWQTRYRRRRAPLVRPGSGRFAGDPVPTLPEPGPSAHRVEGVRLAQLLADEVGAPFVVEVLDPDGVRDRVLPCGDGNNPRARRAFRVLAGEDDLGGCLRRVR